MDAFLELMRQFWMDLQQGQVAPLGLWSYFLLMMLIVLQGPISTMFGGAAAAAGLLNPLGVFLVAAAGNLSADVLWYSVGRYGRHLFERPLLQRFLNRHRSVVELLQHEMREQAIKVLLLAKLSVGMAVPTIVAAGLARVAWHRWFPVVFTGELLWSGSLLLVGYYATGYIIAAESAIVRIGLMVTILLLLMATFYVLRQLQHVKEREEHA